ncbi:MAG: polysaccharide biosynthesis/export family protein [Luteolibacter sp.]
MKKLTPIFLVLLAFSAHAFGQLITPGKAIQITIQGVPPEEKSRIDAMYPVSENGSVNMPYIGHVQAAGLRTDQLAASIQARYKSAEIYTNPTIQVMSDSINSTIADKQLFVGGQVRRTGPVKYTPGLNLYQAIQAAGGPTEFGSMKRVKLIREGKQRQYDLTQAQFMGVPVMPDDTIEVPDKNVWGQ